ncbi:MAG TPA: hypothetical protein PK622_00085 [Saprospiraceae bacterium]|nr:hypothetical protein [Saprospiraceae bacterium]
MQDIKFRSSPSRDSWYFNWKSELQHLSLINRQMMTVHTFFIALTVFLIGLLCVTSASELIETSLGKKISLGLAVFWTIRLFTQIFIYSPILWKGKAFETIIHILLAIFWAYMCLVFWMVC